MKKYQKRIMATIICAIAMSLSACGGGSDTPTVDDAKNNAPVADSNSTIVIQDNNSIIALQATDIDGDLLTYGITIQPQNGTLSLSGNNATYIPNTNFSGTDSFTFTANDGIDDSNEAAISLTVQATSQITAQLTEADGRTIPNASIDVLNESGEILENILAETDGSFVLSGVVEQKLILKVTVDGYANQITPIKLPALKSSNIPINIGMIARGASQTIDIDMGGTLQGNGGSSVTLTAGSFVDKDGNSVTGDITATVTPVDVSNAAILSAFPGDFRGVVEATEVESAIASLGTVEYTFKDSNGDDIQLSDGATAEIEIPIYISTNPKTGSVIEVGDSIDLWSLNEVTGVWDQEGSGIVVVNTSSPTGLALKATVSHFTWWNCDVTIQPGKVIVTVDGGGILTGTAVINARTDVNIGWRPSEVNGNIQIGQTSSPMYIASGGESCIWVDFILSGSMASTQEQCISPVAQNGNYSLTFTLASSASLEVSKSNLNSTYNAQVPLNPVSLFPLSLESMVSYTITSGALPSGLILVPTTNNIGARIQGIPTTAGSYPITIEATDSDSNTDTITLTIVILDPPPPTLDSSLDNYAIPSSNEIENLFNTSLVQNTNVPLPTSWSITNADGSPAPTNVSLSNAGELSITSYDGNSAIYHVIAYNISGASNTLIVNVIPLTPPALGSPQTYTHRFPNTGESQLVASIAINPFNTGGAIPLSYTTSSPFWSVSPNNATVNISGRGDLTYRGGSPGAYQVTATNEVGSSTMTVNFIDDVIDCISDPNQIDCPPLTELPPL